MSEWEQQDDNVTVLDREPQESELEHEERLQAGERMPPYRLVRKRSRIT